MPKPKPIEYMHYRYGIATGMNLCCECCNFVTIKAGGKTFRKCRAYGVTCSNRSDWAKKWSACGLFGKQIDHQIVSDTAKRMFARLYQPEQIEQEKMKERENNG